MSFTNLFLKLVIADLCRFFQHSFEFCDLFIFCFYHLLGILSYILNWSGKVKLMIIFHLALNSNMFFFTLKRVNDLLNYKTQCIGNKFLWGIPDYFSFPVFRWFPPDLWLLFCSWISDPLSLYSFCPKSTHKVCIKCFTITFFFYNTFCQGLNHSINRNRFYLISVNNTAIKWEHFNTFWTAESCFCWSRSFSSWNRASSIFVLIWIFYKVLKNLVNYCNYWFTPYTHI